MKVTYEKVNDLITVKLGTAMALNDLVQLTMNGLKSMMEETVNIVKREEPDISDQEIRSEIHDQVVVAFSAMAYAFDPESVNYKDVDLNAKPKETTKTKKVAKPQ